MNYTQNIINKSIVKTYCSHYVYSLTLYSAAFVVNHTSLVFFPFHTAVDVSFSQTDATVVEAGGNVSLILSVTGQLDTDLSVSVQVMSQDGTAIGESETENGSIVPTS